MNNQQDNQNENKLDAINYFSDAKKEFTHFAQEVLIKETESINKDEDGNKDEVNKFMECFLNNMVDYVLPRKRLRSEIRSEELWEGLPSINKSRRRSKDSPKEQYFGSELIFKYTDKCESPRSYDIYGKSDDIILDETLSEQNPDFSNFDNGEVPLLGSIFVSSVLESENVSSLNRIDSEHSYSALLPENAEVGDGDRSKEVNASPLSITLSESMKNLSIATSAVALSPVNGCENVEISKVNKKVKKKIQFIKESSQPNFVKYLLNNKEKDGCVTIPALAVETDENSLTSQKQSKRKSGKRDEGQSFRNTNMAEGASALRTEKYCGATTGASKSLDAITPTKRNKEGQDPVPPKRSQRLQKRNSESVNKNRDTDFIYTPLKRLASSPDFCGQGSPTSPPAKVEGDDGGLMDPFSRVKRKSPKSMSKSSSPSKFDTKASKRHEKSATAAKYRDRRYCDRRNSSQSEFYSYYQKLHPAASLDDIRQLQQSGWKDVSLKKKYIYHQRAHNAMQHDLKHSRAKSLKSKEAVAVHGSLKADKVLSADEDPFYELNSEQQYRALRSCCYTLRCVLSYKEYKRFLDDFRFDYRRISSGLQSRRAFHQPKFNGLARELLHEKIKKIRPVVVRRHQQNKRCRQMFLRKVYRRKVAKLIAGERVCFSPAVCSPSLTEALQNLRELEASGELDVQGLCGAAPPTSYLNILGESQALCDNDDLTSIADMNVVEAWARDIPESTLPVLVVNFSQASPLLGFLNQEQYYHKETEEQLYDISAHNFTSWTDGYPDVMCEFISPPCTLSFGLTSAGNIKRRMNERRQQRDLIQSPERTDPVSNDAAAQKASFSSKFSQQKSILTKQFYTQFPVGSPDGSSLILLNGNNAIFAAKFSNQSEIGRVGKSQSVCLTSRKSPNKERKYYTS